MKHNRFLLAENPRKHGDLAIIHTLDPISIITVLEGHHNVPGKHYMHFNYNSELYTLLLHHYFTTNMAAVDDELAKQLADKIIIKAWHWFAAYMAWEDDNIERENNGNEN